MKRHCRARANHRRYFHRRAHSFERQMLQVYSVIIYRTVLSYKIRKGDSSTGTSAHERCDFSYTTNTLHIYVCRLQKRQSKQRAFPHLIVCDVRLTCCRRRGVLAAATHTHTMHRINILNLSWKLLTFGREKLLCIIYLYKFLRAATFSDSDCRNTENGKGMTRKVRLTWKIEKVSIIPYIVQNIKCS